MKFVSLNDLLPQAKKKKIGVPQFNINGYLWIEAILEAATETNKPIIIGVTDRNIQRLGGYRYVSELINLVHDRYSPSSSVVLHLDHGQTVENCKKAIDAGFSSVMFDGSQLELEENISRTKEVVEYAHERNVSVEGEVGSVGGVEDGMTANIKYADPDECLRFIKETGVDALAAALGSVHGEYIEEANLQFDIMEQINNHTDVPLVLHGASGIIDEEIHRILNLGHAKVNYNTELNQEFAKSLRQLFVDDEETYDPKLILEQGKEAIKKMAIQKINLLNK